MVDCHLFLFYFNINDLKDTVVSTNECLIIKLKKKHLKIVSVIFLPVFICLRRMRSVVLSGKW